MIVALSSLNTGLHENVKSHWFIPACHFHKKKKIKLESVTSMESWP